MTDAAKLTASLEVLKPRLEAEINSDPTIAYAVSIATADIPEVVDEITLQSAAAALTAIANGQDRVEEIRKTYTQPLHVAKSELIAIGKPTQILLTGARNQIDLNMRNWRNSAQVVAAMSRIEKNPVPTEPLKEGEAPPITHHVESPPSSVATPHGRASFTSKWTYRVANVLEVPREFYVADPIDGRKVMEAFHSGVRNIPGIEFFQNEKVGRRKS